MSAIPNVFITRGRTLMGRMAFTHRCTVNRATVGAQDDYGASTYSAPFVLASGVPCYLWSETGGEQRTPERESLLRQWYLAVSRTQDVTNLDTISNVTDQFGVTIAQGPLNIANIAIQETHLTLTILGLS